MGVLSDKSDTGPKSRSVSRVNGTLDVEKIFSPLCLRGLCVRIYEKGSRKDAEYAEEEGFLY
jgi:hypothetical protein